MLAASLPSQRRATGVSLILATTLLVGCSVTATPEPSFRARIVVINEYDAEVRVTLGLEGRTKGEPDPAASLRAYPQYRIPPDQQRTVFAGSLSGAPHAAQARIEVFNGRCEWLTTIDHVEIQGDLEIVVDRAGYATAQSGRGAVAPPAQPEAQC